MRNRRLLAAVLFTLLALPALAPLADAADRRGGPGAGNPGAVLGNPRALARYLKLTPAQIAAAKTLREELQAETRPLHEQQKVLHEQLRAQLDAATADACAIGQTMLRLEGTRDQVRAAREEFDEAFSALLTPEQLARYEALKEAARIGEEEGA